MPRLPARGTRLMSGRRRNWASRKRAAPSPVRCTRLMSGRRRNWASRKRAAPAPRSLHSPSEYAERVRRRPAHARRVCDEAWTSPQRCVPSDIDLIAARWRSLAPTPPFGMAPSSATGRPGRPRLAIRRYQRPGRCLRGARLAAPGGSDGIDAREDGTRRSATIGAVDTATAGNAVDSAAAPLPATGTGRGASPGPGR
jgi:hypothetical protein